MTYSRSQKLRRRGEGRRKKEEGRRKKEEIYVFLPKPHAPCPD
jgi:hypothetical protein